MLLNGRSGRYFAAMNTGNGFVNYFPSIFGNLETVIILKGGAGTGKSTFMRKAEKIAKDKGFETEEFLCSSDPTSLDGIIIPEMSLGILDGTSPHIYEAKLPEICEKSIDLSQFLNREKLLTNKTEIKKLITLKSKIYKRVYLLLSIIRNYDEITENIIAPLVNLEKIQNTIKKTTIKLKPTINGEKIRIRSSESTDGNIILCTYAEKANERYAITDLYGIGSIFMKELLNESRAKKLRMEISYNPLNPDTADAIYYPDYNVSYYLGSESDFKEKTINMRRFVENDKLIPYKPELRAITKLKKDCRKEMEIQFRKIKNIHYELEKLYGKAMDYGKLDKYENELLSEIFK